MSNDEYKNCPYCHSSLDDEKVTNIDETKTGYQVSNANDNYVQKHKLNETAQALLGSFHRFPVKRNLELKTIYRADRAVFTGPVRLSL